ncbi:MAG: glycosyltransferase [Alphaproteobacteria bacterium]|nr:glycosyltransferase [Alphaproteobacteria bacterium]
MAYRRAAGAVLDRAEREKWNAPAAIPSLVPVSPHELAPHPAVRHFSRCPEIDCVRHLIAADIVGLAESRAEVTGVGADRVLIAMGAVGEETYAAALAASLGIPFEPLFNTPRHQCELPDERLSEAANTGMLPVRDHNGFGIVVAPHLVDSRHLVQLANSGADMARTLRITSKARLYDFVGRHSAQEIEKRAVDDLRTRHPELSAGVRRFSRTRILTCIALAGLTAIAAPDAAMMAVEVFLVAVFLAWTGLRVFGLLSERLVRRKPRTFSDAELPMYSIIVALYREAAAVPGLVNALRAFDYPAEKLDIKLVLEADDLATRDAVNLLQLGPPFEVHLAPERGPRTKPKALNAALPFVRGAFVAVFDAEDRPEPDQLRMALEAFVAEDDRLACVQARLTIDNTADSWLTGLFTAEYAGLFDVFLPGLAARKLPLPLGGSSNHFRTDVLRRVGAWDPYNMTEDADLGMRLVRFGYRTAVIRSTTYEEAPAHFGPWLRQRTRWFKGWMQTWLVHMRSPARMASELGVTGFLVFQLLVGGSVLAALIHAPFAARIAFNMMTSSPDDTMFSALPVVEVTALAAGYGISVALGLIGLARRNLLGSAWVLILVPVYWLLLSLAAWRALVQLLRDPYRWEKTEHGLARTSRRVAVRNTA